MQKIRAQSRRVRAPLLLALCATNRMAPGNCEAAELKTVVVTASGAEQLLRDQPAIAIQAAREAPRFAFDAGTENRHQDSATHPARAR